MKKKIKKLPKRCAKGYYPGSTFGEKTHLEQAFNEISVMMRATGGFGWKKK